MVFCYKIITESPRRCSLSPRKKSPRVGINVPSSISQLLRSYDYEAGTDLLEAIPDREWRLLAALARKRADDDEQEKLADEFHKLWQKEKEEREIVEAETMHEYKRYIVMKRREEKSRQEFMRHQKFMEALMRQRELMDSIKHKEHRSSVLRAYLDDKKTSLLVDKALEEEARAQLAADRRSLISETDQFRKHVEYMDAQKKADDARKRRNAMLKDTSQKVAIQNALSSWETALLRQEVTAMEAARRANHAAHAALTDARSVRLLRMRDARRRQARRLAAVTQQLRDAIRYGKN
ncbi:hypothetical protein HW555_008030 [Spodoptera exigua]|uniref:Trichohyalin-plectin-homology domain-containing protein n=1 Tax=Spodoptera exigua TaxID=7107 RepID=A0A835GF41_SPOEX|nr:hypothetical protein HW555_008030 [Spodoptera exigua]